VAGGVVRGKPDPIVADLQHELVAAIPDSQIHAVGAGVFDDIVQGFLRDAIDGLFELVRQLGLIPPVGPDLQPVAGADGVEVLRQCRQQPLGFERHSYGVRPEDIPDDEPLIGSARFGLDSLDALELVLAIEKEFDVKIGSSEESRQALGSVNTLAAYLRACPAGA